MLSPFENLMARLLGLALTFTLTAAAFVACSGTTHCEPPAGGRCAGPEPLMVTAGGAYGVGVTADDRTVVAVVPCGGRLEVKESATAVTLTWIASAVGAGAMSCAIVPLAKRLRSPLGARHLVDGPTGDRLPVGQCRPNRYGYLTCRGTPDATS